MSSYCKGGPCRGLYSKVGPCRSLYSKVRTCRRLYSKGGQVGVCTVR